jgi:group I intron endonuclease
MGWIYSATNKINRKSYIGQTIRPIKERLKEHEIGKSSNCKAFYGAVKKYGWENFEIDWYECSDDELNKHEKWMVRLMGTLSPDGYNLREGGGSRGKFCIETRKRLSKMRIGIGNHRYGTKMSEATRKKLKDSWTKEKRKEHGLKTSGYRNPMFGKPRTKQTINKLKLWWTDDRKKQQSKAKSGENNPMFGVRGEEHPWWGRSHTEESIQKIKDSQLNSQKVYQYDLEGKYIQSFDSYREAGRQLKYDYTPISRCARSKQKTAYGFKWSRIPPSL